MSEKFQKKRRLSTTISSDLYDFLEQEAFKKNVPVNTILEKAIMFFKKRQIEKELQKGCEENAGIDLVMHKEWEGIEDMSPNSIMYE